MTTNDPLERMLRAKLGLPDPDDDEQDQDTGPAPIALNDGDALARSITAALGIPTTTVTEL